MNRIWVRLWLGIVISGIGSVACFTCAALLGVWLFGDNPANEGQTALLITLFGFGGTFLLSVLVAAFIARRLARPLVAVSEAARQVAGGDLSARASQGRRSGYQRQHKRPLKALSEAVQRVSEGNLGARAALRRSAGERRRVQRRFKRLYAKRPRTLGPASTRQAQRRRKWLAKQRRKRRKGAGEAEQLLADFNLMAASLERLETERQATTAAIAHDLRTPLTILWGRLAGARDGLIALDAAEIALLLGQTELLARMVEDLRTLSLAEVGKLSLRCAELEVSELVERVVAGYVSQAAQKAVTLTASVTPQVRLSADADRLQQILVNLLDNALRFTPEGGRVWIGLETSKRSATLSVRDDGPGIGAAALEHIFKRFYREDAARTGAGTGLGLAIVRSLVTLHGGTVTASNHPSGGALFEVTLPRVRSA